MRGESLWEEMEAGNKTLGLVYKNQRRNRNLLGSEMIWKPPRPGLVKAFHYQVDLLQVYYAKGVEYICSYPHRMIAWPLPLVYMQRHWSVRVLSCLLQSQARERYIQDLNQEHLIWYDLHICSTECSRIIPLHFFFFEKSPSYQNLSIISKSE